MTDYIYETMSEHLRTGHYRAGERLTEARLTAELGVSRVPLREVLRRLAAEGAIEINPHRGASVRILTRDHIAQLFQVRMAVEGMAARLAAQRINEPGMRDQIMKLLELACPVHDPDAHDLGNDETPGGGAGNPSESQIHGGIVEQSGNELLLAHWKMLEFPVHRLRYQSRTQPEQRLLSQRDHEAVLRAILAGDHEQAQRQMSNHVERVANAIHQLRDEEFNATVNPGLVPGET
ncbi:GntR family transcriptional regulator [Streptosporangium sp. NPDC006930]|uniref:GntR family transcriptional regulator n=1 Tax=unclassified Streptosporangium TaxID=2632669 RepID=UPI00342D7F2E